MKAGIGILIIALTDAISSICPPKNSAFDKKRQRGMYE